MAQLKEQPLGEPPASYRRIWCSAEEQDFLDDVTVAQLSETALQVKVDIVKSSGQDLVKAF